MCLAKSLHKQNQHATGNALLKVAQFILSTVPPRSIFQAGWETPLLQQQRNPSGGVPRPAAMTQILTYAEDSNSIWNALVGYQPRRSNTVFEKAGGRGPRPLQQQYVLSSRGGNPPLQQHPPYIKMHQGGGSHHAPGLVLVHSYWCRRGPRCISDHPRQSLDSIAGGGLAASPQPPPPPPPLSLRSIAGGGCPPPPDPPRFLNAPGGGEDHKECGKCTSA